MDRSNKSKRTALAGILLANIAFTGSAFSGQHNLDYAYSAAATEISISTKTYNGQTDKVFKDALGRERSFRGFNVSGKVKLAQFGFQPFKNVEDARASLSLLGQQTGSNIVRYTLAWEGIHTAADTINYDYLDNAIAYMKEAMRNDIYVLLDYHSDLYSRHTFTPDSDNTGNGAPKWAVADINGKDNCGIPCKVTWSAHKLSDDAVRNAMRSFWYDHWVMDRHLAEAELYLPDTNTCADIKDGSTANSTTVLTANCNGQPGQQWHYQQDGSLYLAKDNSKCLDVAGARTSDNTDIQIYQCNGTKAQQFILDRRGRLHSALDFNKCVQNNNGNFKLAECSTSNTNQQLMLRDTATGKSLGEQLTYVQTAFVWQIGQVARYIKSKLTPKEFAQIIGLEPINEPFDGGIGQMSYKDFDNKILWPFYERVRAELDRQGWQNKEVFAEPMVFWSSIAGITAPATGGHYLDYQPGDGFVFTPHFYDQARMGVADLSVARNAGYFGNLDLIRDEARYLNLAPFLSEFGMWLEGYGHTDTSRVVNGTYQAMESSDRVHGKDRFVDFYTPLVSGTQWGWDYYYDNHYELQNGNPDNIKTQDDAWNNENFSVISHYGANYNVRQELVERAYPRAIQGDLMHFAYEGKVRDEGSETMTYHSIRATLADHFINKEFFRNTRFAFAAWRGRNSDAPTEIYLPRLMQSQNLVIITDKGIHQNLPLSTTPNQSNNEVMLSTDPHKQAGAGHLLRIWDDADAGENTSTMHFALIIDGNAGLGSGDLVKLQSAINQMLAQGKSPVYLTTDMTHGGYPDDKGSSNSYFSLINKNNGRCLDVAGGWTFNGTNVQSYDCNNSRAQKWFYEASTGFVRSRLNWNKCLDNGGQFYNNGKLVLWSCQNSDNMRWNITGNSLRPRTAHRMAVHAFGTGNSSNVGLWSYLGGNEQQWISAY
ncbi:ricin-type beta-trefoil lectin domain protein [Thalassomonas viridans]|uniref:Ricin-type beta-trefoil lectin domain protein n=1 Tax=Thalassomonas viridans TaxID=137584 RepID=A0AAF0CAY6_9GAMM|nr:ricin-type beta-trefoil lectin domain protein [Thalassomonas viridans]WDE09132.1 ricin-type beta-trefoil lectin domain protein [Thalassomonas viridans]